MRHKTFRLLAGILAGVILAQAVPVWAEDGQEAQADRAVQDGQEAQVSQAAEDNQTAEMVQELFGGKKSAFGNVTAPAAFDWKQCKGITLDFIVENNINANILSRECSKFSQVTGINVRIRNADFNTMQERINMEFISGIGQYDLIYIDPYQTLTRFSDSLEDLYPYEQDPELPHIVGGLDSFSEDQVNICSYFKDKEKLCAIPFDSTTMILYYRKDIFDKYGEAMAEDLGFQPIPGSAAFTWEQFIETATWIGEHVPKEEITYPCVTMSANHNSIYTEFSNLLSAYGGDYFKEEQVSSLGIDCGGEIQSREESFITALDVYQRLAGIVPEQAGQMNWDETAQMFKDGKIAMMINWDENAAMMENDKDSAVSGKTGYAVLPYGSERSANIYGGSGVGINKNISQEKKLAAWMFIVWCTSPQVQINTFLTEEGGNMPTRTSLLHLIAGQYMVRLPQAPAVINAQKQTYVYYRPKMSAGYQFEKIITDNLYKMVKEKKEPRQVGEQIWQEWEEYLASRTHGG